MVSYCPRSPAKHQNLPPRRRVTLLAREAGYPSPLLAREAGYPSPLLAREAGYPSPLLAREAGYPSPLLAREAGQIVLSWRSGLSSLLDLGNQAV
nr:hypothetical protein [Deltaproteobacteria bacterium]